MDTTVSKAEFDELKADYNKLKYQYSQLIKLLNGSKSERFAPADDAGLQTQLFEGSEDAPTTSPPETDAKNATSNKKRTKRGPHPGRTPFPNHLPEEIVDIYPEGVDTSDMVPLGFIETRKVEYVPGKLVVIVYRRHRYVRREDEQLGEQAKFAIGQLPATALWKSMAAVGLLAEIVVAKFIDHLPFNRQIARFLRDHGWKVHPATMNNWFIGTCERLEPLYPALRMDVLTTDYLQGDESRLLVLERQSKDNLTSTKEKKRQYQKKHLGYMWVFRNPITGNVFFVYRKGRGANVLHETLENFTGLLQSDGYIAYETYIKKHDVELVSCLAHIRRKFYDALDNNKGLSTMVLSCIQYIYSVDRLCKERNYTPERRLKMRKRRSEPVYNMLLDFLQFYKANNIRTGAFPEAVRYACNHLPRLKWAFEDGRIELDNNQIENKIRPLALGRKNYMFAGSNKGAERIAMMYSFMSSCKANDVNPREWLQDVLIRLETKEYDNLTDLLPGQWKKQTSL